MKGWALAMSSTTLLLAMCPVPRVVNGGGARVWACPRDRQVHLDQLHNVKGPQKLQQETWAAAAPPCSHLLSWPWAWTRLAESWPLSSLLQLGAFS